MKMCLYDDGHMTKMAALSIYGQNSSSLVARFQLNLVCNIEDSNPLKFVQLMTLG